MNEMRKLMETVEKLYEEPDFSNWPRTVGHGSGNADIIHAYDDEKRYGRGRQLVDYGHPSSLGTWYDVMKAALDWTGGTYNNFEVDQVYNVLKSYPEHDFFYYIAAREYSPALYIGSRAKDKMAALKEFEEFIQENQSALEVDEIHLRSKTDFSDSPAIRLWWD
jgi:hypothetical protein